MSGDTITVDGHDISLSDTDKVLFPEAGLTKGDLIDYYRKLAPTALPHFRDRALTMQRFPDGIGRDGFFQKAIPDYFPDWIDRVEVPKEGGRITHVVVNSAATLVYLANQACITPHLALARSTTPDRPDRMIFDLDPSSGDFAMVQEVATRLRDRLTAGGLPVYVQVTGSRGMHLVVPLDGSAAFDPVRAFARRIASALADEVPKLATVAARKSDRGRRVYVDTMRNAYGQIGVAPYGVRARPGAPVATPLTWDEAMADDMMPDRYTIRNLFRRLGQTDDPWAGMAQHAVDASALA